MLAKFLQIPNYELSVPAHQHAVTACLRLRTCGPLLTLKRVSEGTLQGPLAGALPGPLISSSAFFRQSACKCHGISEIHAVMHRAVDS